VVLNTSLVAQQVYSLVFFVGLAISLVWCYNVTNVAISSWRDKFIHSLGSATGSLAGLAVGDWLGSLSFIF
jgi:ABC-type transport system involved in Fe-S cluster assembly fused permease/ATPase subunit